MPPARHWAGSGSNCRRSTRTRYCTRPLAAPDPSTTADDARIPSGAKQVAWAEALKPAMRGMLTMGVSIVSECLVFLFLYLRSLLIETQAYIPSYWLWLEKAVMRGAYALHRV